MMSREGVEAVLNCVRPLLQADGGDIELIAVEGNSARVRLLGMCSACPSAHMTLFMGVENALRDAIPEFQELYLV
jgi:Fe-S cluster biogenesis protein NfuA